MSLASLTVVEVVEVLVVEAAGLDSFLADSSIFLEDSLWGEVFARSGVGGGGGRTEKKNHRYLSLFRQSIDFLAADMRQV